MDNNVVNGGHSEMLSLNKKIRHLLAMENLKTKAGTSPESVEFIAPDKPMTCTWHLGAPSSSSPHTTSQKTGVTPPISNNILEQIGNSPMVRINKTGKAEGVECEILVKCEFSNPGGSMKDRIAVRMIEDAERAGILKPGGVIIEPTSGNTGIGLAMAALVKGYKLVIVMPEKMSNEKVYVLRALGAEIVRAPSKARYFAPESYIRVAQRLRSQIPGAVILDQYRNPSNPLTHYDTTAEEIIEQCGGDIDYAVLPTGTGGVITGVGRKLKEKIPKVKIVSYDPEGSVLAPDELNTKTGGTLLEGIGKDYRPTCFDQGIVDIWYKSKDYESFMYARRMISEEGLLCGGSSGTAMWCAVQLAKDLNLGKDKRIVVLLPDSVRNYMTKYLSDDWMVKHNLMNPNDHPIFSDQWWWDVKVTSLDLSKATTVTSTTTVADAVQLLNKGGIDNLPILEGGEVKGMVTIDGLMSRLVSGKIDHSSRVTEAINEQLTQLSKDCSLGKLSRVLEYDHFALIVERGAGVEAVCRVATRRDLVAYITSGRKQTKHATHTLHSG